MEEQSVILLLQGSSQAELRGSRGIFMLRDRETAVTDPLCKHL